MGIPSSGLHSNGYSMVRNILNRNKININRSIFLKKELLKPTKIYVKEILNLLDKNLIHGCAHITGGGIPGNLIRVMPDNICANIDLNKIRTKPIFKWIKTKGVSDNEMLKTFNCGIGFCIITKKKISIRLKNILVRNINPTKSVTL